MPLTGVSLCCSASQLMLQEQAAESSLKTEEDEKVCQLVLMMLMSGVVCWRRFPADADDARVGGLFTDAQAASTCSGPERFPADAHAAHWVSLCCSASQLMLQAQAAASSLKTEEDEKVCQLMLMMLMSGVVVLETFPG